MERHLLTYWRNSLADEDIMGTNDGEADESLLPVPSGGIAPNGTLAAPLTNALRSQWKEIIDRAKKSRTTADFRKDDDPNVVPVVIFTRALGPKHSHGAVVGARRSTITFTMVIPAILTANGILSPDPENDPWIARQYLAPTITDGDDIPVVGPVEAFDQWLDHHPVDSSDWAGLSAWCDGLWDAVTGGDTPEGFVEVASTKIRAAKTSRDIGRQIRQLYDSLLEEPELPPLLARLCKPGLVVAAEVDREVRLLQLRAPRGTMGSAHGLADSQADAIAALTRLGSGEALAVNGPPGTGKTTLLQSVIATETVKAALAGGDPPIIVGCSTNNQAVTNINRAMNDALQADRSGDRFSWARRWVPDAETYGLFLPASSKASEAEAAGFRVATKEGKTWTGFPSREVESELVEEAARSWLEGFAKTYGKAVLTPEDGLSPLRNDLESLLGDVSDVATTLDGWEAIEKWWARTAGELVPQIYVDGQRSEAQRREAEAAGTMEAAVRREAAVVAEWQERLTDLAASIVRATELLDASTNRVNANSRMKARIAAAGAPDGFLEIAAQFLPFLRNIATVRQHARRLAVLSPDEEKLCCGVLDLPDQEAWLSHLNALTEELGREQSELHSRHRNLQEDRSTAEMNRTAAEGAARRAVEEADRQQKNIQAENRHLLDQLVAQLAVLGRERVAVEQVYDRLRQRSAKKYDDPGVRVGIRPDWLGVIDRTLDVSIRYEMFQKAMRYWEGRWIVEARKLCADPKIANKQGRADTLARFRRWCMLMPCLVTTLHSLPKHFRFLRFLTKAAPDGGKQFASDFLLGGIDLLIMDEAGQVAPHVGMAAFALADRTVVVGDISQIEPVQKIARGTDLANSVKAGLTHLWKDGYPLWPHILSEDLEGNLGSVMRVIQMSTAFSIQGAPQPGIFLSEHRRCDPEIIQFCNDLVYGGRLHALTKPVSKPPGMRAWGWAHVRGTCLKRRGSRVNDREAQSIAAWIVKRAEAWLSHYQELDALKFDGLNKIVAVITPFSAQAEAIRAVLETQGDRYASITVGTVHALQGAECPIVIFSPTYSAAPNGESQGAMFFDRKPNMLNVAVSRAKDSFVVIGDMRMFRQTSSRRPSSVMAKYLIEQSDNEISDVDGNYRFTPEVLKNAERISTLERHREVLAQAFLSVSGGEALVIVSPYVSRHAVEADGVPDLCRRAVANGGAVHIVVDQRHAIDRNKGAPEAISALQGAGATVHKVAAIHSKTLIVGDRQIVEGSFNWLSALRDRANRFFNHESSYLVTGTPAASDISQAVKEIVQLGAKIGDRIKVAAVLGQKAIKADQQSQAGANGQDPMAQAESPEDLISAYNKAYDAQYAALRSSDTTVEQMRDLRMQRGEAAQKILQNPEARAMAAESAKGGISAVETVAKQALEETSKGVVVKVAARLTL